MRRLELLVQTDQVAAVEHEPRARVEGVDLVDEPAQSLERTPVGRDVGVGHMNERVVVLALPGRLEHELHVCA